MNFLRLALETRKKGAVISLFLNIPKFNVKTNHVHVAVYTSEATNTKFLEFRAFLWRCHYFLRLQRKFLKIQRKIFHFCSHLRQEGQIDLIPSPDCCIFIAVSKNTHNGHFWRHNDQTAIWPFNAIMAKWLYSHMAIMASKMDNMGDNGNSNKNAAIWGRPSIKKIRATMVQWNSFLYIFGNCKT